MDINNENGTEVTMDEYIETIRLRPVFSVAGAGGAMIGGASKEVVDAVHGCTMNLGVAFQMYDDILGIVGTRPLPVNRPVMTFAKGKHRHRVPRPEEHS